MSTYPQSLGTKEIIDRIFKEPGIRYELTEFVSLGKPIHEILSIYPKVTTTGKDVGKTKYFLKSLIPFSSGNEEVQVYVEGGKSAPEEIVRQIWTYKLIHQYGYQADEIELETSVQFGTEVGTKAADIVVYTDHTKATPKIIVECKKPKRKDGIEQLKSYMNAKGAPVAIWSNGADSIILYRPYPNDYDDTLFDLPKRGQLPADVLAARKTLLQLKQDFNFKKIIQDLEELVLADSGKDEFNEIFKLIFAKIWDEKEAQENRKDKTVEFGKVTTRRIVNGAEKLMVDADLTFDRINSLFHRACEEWPGIFRQGEDIELAKRHLQVCVGPIEGVRLFGSNLRIMDDAFEYLLPTEAKKKKGQFFTPRHVVEMCVRMLNPTAKEYVMDPACGSGGFLLHAMDWCYPARDNDQRELRKHRYASKYLWGVDFEQRAAKTSRALMLIAGDGHTNIFGPDVSSLDPRTWYETGSGQELMQGLRRARLTAVTIPEHEPLTDEEKAWHYFDELRFDVILANPPFAGEMKDRKMLGHYELARPALKRAGDDKQPKEERDVLFIERILKMLKPGGRAAIVLPQGKFNNSSLAFIREWILRKARLLAVVGLHPNTFKPHTGTKTSVLFVQRYTQAELERIARVHDEVAGDCPDYAAVIRAVLAAHAEAPDVLEDAIPDAVAELIAETFAELELEQDASEDLPSENGDNDNRADDNADGTEPVPSDEDRVAQAEDRLEQLKAERLRVKQRLVDLESDLDALEEQQQAEMDALKLQHQEEIERVEAAWTGGKTALTAELRPLKADHRNAIKDMRGEYSVRIKVSKAEQKERRKALNAALKRLDQAVAQAERELKLLTNRGRLELVLADEELTGTLKERWIAAEVAKRLDYPIFMAVSGQAGKNNSGEYEFRVDADGSLIEFPDGHPQAGQLVIHQDLVNYNLTRDNLAEAVSIPHEQICIAKAFVRFAQGQGFNFWDDRLTASNGEIPMSPAYPAEFVQVAASRRFDPEHFFPAFAALQKGLPADVSLEPLGRHLTFCQRGKQPAYGDTGLPVINSKHVQPNRVLLGNNRRAAPNPDQRIQIRYGDVLLNGTGRGTLGRAAPYLFQEPAVPDNHVTILRSDDLDPVYLALYLNSAAGQLQVEMHQRGSSGQLELYPFDIRKFLVWPAPPEFQQELRALHDQAAAAERQAKILLEQAKTRVEQLIEKAVRG